MKAFILLVAFLFSVNNSKYSIEEITVNHDIKAVTIFLNSAEITREAKIKIPRGKTELVFKGISSKILKEGIKAHISNNITVYAINIEENKDSFESNSDWKNIENEIGKLNGDKALINVELNTLNAGLKYLESNMKIGGNGIVSYVKIDEGAIYFRNKIKKIQNQIYEQKERLNELLKIENKLEDKQEKLIDKLEKINTNIRITILSDENVACNVKLQYLVSNAIWKPYYSIRTKGINEDVTLEYQAQVFNDTGNDWNNKPLTLAMINPSEDVSKPKMNTWVLNDDNDDHNKYSGEGRLSKAKGNFYKREKDENIEYDVLQVDDLSTRFEIKDLHIIPSDAMPHLIDVKTYIKKANYYILSIPKVKDGAFIIARIPDWENMGLLDGPISLYYNDTFQGVSRLDTQQVEGTLDISLGRDNSYTITRRKLKSMSREKLIGTSINEVLTYEFIIKNNKNKEVEIELRDQLPVSIDKNVEVKALEINGAETDTQSGQLTWELKLKPFENKKIILKYSVKYPKKRRGLFKHARKNLKSPRFF